MKGGNINMLDSGLGPDAMSSFNKHRSQQERKQVATGMDGGQRASSALRLSDKKSRTQLRKRATGVPGGVLDKYDAYGRAHELDVAYTVNAEIDADNDRYKSRKLRLHNDAEDRRQKEEKARWRAKISAALVAYCDYKSETTIGAHVAEKERKTKEKKDKEKTLKLKKAGKPLEEAAGDKKAQSLKKPVGKPGASGKPSPSRGPKTAAADSGDDYSEMSDDQELRKPAASATMFAPQDLKSRMKVQEEKKGKATALDLLKAKADPDFFNDVIKKNEQKRKDLEVIFFLVLSIKFTKNFITDDIEAENFGQDQRAPEEPKATPKKKRKQQPLMANSEAEVRDIYFSNKERAEAKVKMTDNELAKVLKDFFQADEVVRRLELYKDRINTSRRRGAITLYSFYLNTLPHDRLAYLFSLPDDKAAKEAIANYIEKQEKETKKRERAALKEKAERDAKGTQQVKKKVFGESYKKTEDGKWEIELKNRPDYTKPKDKWKLGRQLLELQKDFPHDRALQRMVDEEFKANQTFKYPEEYDVYDGALEHSLKKNFYPQGDVAQGAGGGIAWKVPDFSKEQEAIENFKKRDHYDREEAKRARRAAADAMKKLEQYLEKKAIDYHEYMAKRSQMLPGF